MARKPHPALRTNKPPPRRRPPPRWSPKQVYAWTVLFTAIVLAVNIPMNAPRTAAHPALGHKSGGGVVGVAFHLTPEYGLAFIHHENGSTVSVARIPGSPSYAAFMRDPSSLEQTRPRTRVCNAVANLQIEVPRFDIPTPLSCLPPAALAVRPLIAALKSEVETYLGTRICFAALVVDDREGGPYRKAAATALGSVGLANVRVTRGKRYRAGSPCLPFFRFEVDDVASHSLFPIVDAQVALMEPLPADDEKAWTVLSVHYEPHSFITARFWVGGEQGKGKERVRAVPGWLTAPIVFENASDTWPALDARLRAERSDPEPPPHIDRLILSGVSAREPKLHALLTDLHGKNLTDSAYVDEDVSTAARGVVAKAYAAMQGPSFGAENHGWGSFVCQCASGLHASRWWDVVTMARYDLAERVRLDARALVEWIRYGYSGTWRRELRYLANQLLDDLSGVWNGVIRFLRF